MRWYISLLCFYTSYAYKVHDFTKGIISAPDIYGINHFYAAPCGITIDEWDNVYITEDSNNVIKRIDNVTKVVTLIAGKRGISGTENGIGTNASFSGPTGISYFKHALYVTDKNSDRVRKINLTNNDVTTFQDPISGAVLNFRDPWGIWANGSVFVVENEGNYISKIDSAGIKSTVIGLGTPSFTDGNATYARLNVPRGIVPDSRGNLIISDVSSRALRKLDSRIILSRYCGNATAPEIENDAPCSLFNMAALNQIGIDKDDMVYFSSKSCKLYKTDGSYVWLVAGSVCGFFDGPALQSGIAQITAITVDSKGNVIFTDQTNNVIRVLNTTGYVSVFSGARLNGFKNGHLNIAVMNNPKGIASDSQGRIFITDTDNQVIRMIVNETVSTFVGQQGLSGTSDGSGLNALLTSPTGIAVGPDDSLYFSEPSLNRIRKVTPDGTVSVFVGTGTSGLINGQTPRFFNPDGLFMDSNNILYVADTSNNVIRMVNQTGFTSTVAGTGLSGFVNGAGNSSRFNSPTGLIMKDGLIYVADFGNRRIRLINSTNHVSTFAGAGQAGSDDGPALQAKFNGPRGITVDSNGNVYVSEYLNHVIRMINTTGYVSTLAGTVGTSGYTNGYDLNTEFYRPYHLLWKDEYLYVADSSNGRIRRISNETFIPVASTTETTLPTSNSTVNQTISLSNQTESIVYNQTSANETESNPYFNQTVNLNQTFSNQTLNDTTINPGYNSSIPGYNSSNPGYNSSIPGNSSSNPIVSSSVFSVRNTATVNTISTSTTNGSDNLKQTEADNIPVIVGSSVGATVFILGAMGLYVLRHQKGIRRTRIKAPARPKRRPTQTQMKLNIDVQSRIQDFKYSTTVKSPVNRKNVKVV
jgi:streptogramin lyase